MPGQIFWPNLPRWKAELTTWRGKFGHHDLISLTEVYPLLYRDIGLGLAGLVPPYCALLEYKVFANQVVIVQNCTFSKMGPYLPQSPLLFFAEKVGSGIVTGYRSHLNPLYTNGFFLLV